ncbi:hypothetical protein [Bacillus horti]|uniref:Uncharacterized protein n=1 Tax=Caldalkalibacillus horti TaxID=77523 RepID=A0ABT9W457_9BACI|nr:hypothetical protein [Bacillus horti]MDQ0168016.1 hypothetical protein [Bacillus horti]
MKNMRREVKELTEEPRNKIYWDMKDMVGGLKRKITGFSNFIFSHRLLKDG